MVKQNKTEMPLAPIERIIKKTTKMLVSESAALELRKVLTEFAEEIALDAAELAAFTNRKTIKDRDITLAFKNRIKNR